MIRVCTPFPHSQLPRVWAWVQEFRANVADDFSPQNFEDFLDHWMAREEAGQLSWAVYRGTDLGGMVSFDPTSPWTGTLHATFARRFWGAENTVPSVRECARQVFQRGYGKILLMPFRSNWQVRGLVKMLGAKQEGLLKAQTLQNGEPKAIAVYGLTLKDFTEVQDAISDSSGNSRSGSVGGRPGGPQGSENPDHQQHQHPNPIPGTPEDAGSPGGPPDRAA